MDKIRLKGEDFDRIVLNPKKDNCLLCGEKLSGVGFTWNLFHGEASSSCCGADYQLKSWWVDKEKYPEIYEFSESLDNPDRIFFKIAEKWLEPLRKAMSELGLKNIRDTGVIELAKKYIEKEEL